MGMQGAIVVYGDGSSCTLPAAGTTSDNPCNAEAAVCLSGTMSPSSAKWGCGMDVQLHRDGGADGGVLTPYTGPATCFDFVFSGSTGGNPLRIAFGQKADASDGTIAPFKDIPPFANGWSGRMCFGDVSCPAQWAGKNCPAGTGATSDSIYTIKVEIPGGMNANAYGICLTSLVPVDTSCGSTACSPIVIDRLEHDAFKEGGVYTKDFDVAASYATATMSVDFDNSMGPNLQLPPTITVSNAIHTKTVSVADYIPASTASTSYCLVPNSDGSSDYNCPFGVRFDVTDILVPGKNTLNIKSGRSDDDYVFSTLKVDLTSCGLIGTITPDAGVVDTAITSDTSGAALADLTGTWTVAEVVPPGQGGAGTYPGQWVLQNINGQLSGSATWSTVNRHSTLSGSVIGDAVHIQRVDTDGFRGFFDGTVSPDGSTMSGTGQNDPSSPGGNAATYTWTAVRG